MSAEPDVYLVNKMRHKMALAKEFRDPSQRCFIEIYNSLAKAILVETAEVRRTAVVRFRALDCADMQAMADNSWVFPTLVKAVSNLTWKLTFDMPMQTTYIELRWS